MTGKASRSGATAAAGRAVRMPRGVARRAHDWLRGSGSGLVALALLTGAGAGAGAVAFRYLILGFTELFTGRADYSGAGHAPSPRFPGLGMFFVLLVPVIAGLVYGPLVDRFAREARGHGVPEVMLAVAERGGRIAPQVAVIKSLASALCIGSGGSVGREGPIVQIGSALGSALGQWLKVPESRLRLLVACGAAGGISATFNAPVAGVFFALELILRDFEAESFGVVVLASVTASVIGRAAFGNHPFLALPPFHLASPVGFVFYGVLGVAGALAGVGFTRVLYGIEDLCDRARRGPEWLRPAAGGVLLGGLLLVLPQMYGVGYPVLQNGVAGRYAAAFLLVLLAGKMLATSLTIGIGGSGGVFAPSLFMGAMLGTAAGDLLHLAVPHLAGPPGAYGLVGMGAVFAGAARAPITAVLIIFELTGDYAIVLPLMTAVVLAAGVSAKLSADTIYTLKLRRRGIDLLRGRPASVLEILTVADAMRPVLAALTPESSLDQVIARFAADGCEALPVVDDDGTYRGTVTAREAEEAARSNTLDATAGQLARALPALHAGQTLHSALTALLAREGSGLPVLSADGTRLAGWLNHRDVLRAYATRLRRATAQPGPVPADRTATPAEASGQDTADLGGYRVIDIELTSTQAPAGLRLAELAWPPSAHLLALRRDGCTTAATSGTILQQGDRLTILLPAGHAADADELLRGTPAAGPGPGPG